MVPHTMRRVEAEDATRSVLDSLRRLVRELRVFSRHAESQFGLSAAQLFVLQRVAEHGPLSVNALAELTFTHQSTVSVVAQRLEDRGLLERRRSDQDGRQKDLTITSAGRATLQRAPLSVQDRLIAAMLAMNPDDRDSLARTLSDLVRSIGSEDARAVLFFEQESSSEAKPPRRRRTRQ